MPTVTYFSYSLHIQSQHGLHHTLNDYVSIGVVDELVLM